MKAMSNRFGKVAMSLLLALPALAQGQQDPGFCNRLKQGDATSGCAIAGAGGLAAAVATYKTVKIGRQNLDEAGLVSAQNSRDLIKVEMNPRTIDENLMSRMRTEIGDGDFTEVKVLLTEPESRKEWVRILQNEISSAQASERNNRALALQAMIPQPVYETNSKGEQVFKGMKVDVASATMYENMATEAAQEAAEKSQRLFEVKNGAPIKILSQTHQFEGSSSQKVHEYLAAEARRGSRVERVTNLSSQFYKQVQ